MRNLAFFILLAVLSCTDPASKQSSPVSGTSSIDSLKTASKDVQGYRLSITGDFNGDGNTETLSEHFISTITGKDTNKFYSTNDYDSMVVWTIRKKPRCFMLSSNDEIDTLKIRVADDPRGGNQLFGLAYMKNEGDLDNNGTDEVSFVVDWADWSSLNTCHLYTYTKKGWKELFAFSTMDYIIPVLDHEGKITGESDKDFKGLIRKNSKGQIEIYTDVPGDAGTFEWQAASLK